MSSMAGFMGGVTARIVMNTMGYEKPVMKLAKSTFKSKPHMSAPSVRTLRTHTMNRVVNHRLGDNPIASDTQLSNLI